MASCRSAYEYRRTNRGGQGITNIDNIERNGPVVASFPATQGRAADAGDRPGQADPHRPQSLRVIGRGCAGVRLFNVADNEHVVSAVRIDEQEEPENEAEEAIVEEMLGRESEERPDTAAATTRLTSSRPASDRSLRLGSCSVSAEFAREARDSFSDTAPPAAEAPPRQGS